MGDLLPHRTAVLTAVRVGGGSPAKGGQHSCGYITIVSCSCTPQMGNSSTIKFIDTLEFVCGIFKFFLGLCHKKILTLKNYSAGTQFENQIYKVTHIPKTPDG